MTVLVEKGAGASAYYSDASYEQAGAKVVNRQTALDDGNVIAVINNPGDETLAKLKLARLF